MMRIVSQIVKKLNNSDYCIGVWGHEKEKDSPEIFVYGAPKMD